MAQQKLYAGVKLREWRSRLGLSQAAFASQLGVSPPYLNQMEQNHRPVSTVVVLALAREFGLDVAELTSGDAERVVADLREVLADPVFTGPAPAQADLRLAASNTPALARAFLDLHRAYRQSQDRLALMDQALGNETPGLSPWDEVRDFFHYCDNYLDDLDQAAEAFAATAADPAQKAVARLASLGVQLETHDDAQDLRRYDPETRRLSLAKGAHDATHRFQLLHQLALLTEAPRIEATLDRGHFKTSAARNIARIGLANYFAGAALMPYAAFLTVARETRHDLERLADRFGASLEQVAHRLSTLQRPGQKGIPFFFVRVDRAGTITKRHSAARLQFARFGGACPLWNVHAAFETPGRFLRQLAETPDGSRYLCLARDVTKSGGSFHAPIRRYAIGLGCDIAHAADLVYADGLDLRAPFDPIGISCRICNRPACPQRSVPPLAETLQIDPHHRGLLPYTFAP